jgi:hypothetical protein
MNEIQDFLQRTMELIWERIPSNLKGYVIEKVDDIEDMISLRKNEYGEYDLPYPDHIDTCWTDFYENNMSPEAACASMVHGVITLLEGSASVM